jgi:hypothetical protein
MAFWAVSQGAGTQSVSDNDQIIDVPDVDGPVDEGTVVSDLEDNDDEWAVITEGGDTPNAPGGPTVDRLSRRRAPRVLSTPEVGEQPEPVVIFTATRAEANKRPRGDPKTRGGPRAEAEGQVGQFMATMTDALAPKTRAAEVAKREKHEEKLFGMFTSAVTTSNQSNTILALQQKLSKTEAKLAGLQAVEQYRRRMERGGGGRSQYRSQSHSSDNNDGSVSQSRSSSSRRSQGRGRHRDWSSSERGGSQRIHLRDYHRRSHSERSEGNDGLGRKDYIRVKEEENHEIVLPANCVSGGEVIVTP